MEATQESTQPCADPRRMGMNNSGIQDQDLADIICILHPNSHAAHDAVSATGGICPQHILQRDILGHDSSHTASLDLALRLSSKVHNLGLGFCFGRNRSRCDILLSVDDNAKRVSNNHFRIYLTEDGILMLQDTSTNGTIVDNCRLRKSQKDGNSRMLTNGSVIQVVTGCQNSDEVRFVVRIPLREGFAVHYHQNLFRYFERVHAHAPAHKERQGPSPSALAWSSANAYGMHWTGGAMYNVTGQIGKGAFATVYKIATKQHGAIYAAKELDKRRFMKNGILDQKVDNEMKIMRDLRHPNIVQYIDHHEHDRWIYIIMEYVPGGELSTYLHTQERIPEEMVRTIARQVLRALHYLHKRHITHRDIKPDNILIASLDPLRIKLSDFGLSKVVEQETFLKTFCGTLLYCAPEVYPDYDQYRRGELRKRRRVGDPTSPYSQSVDMWSLGAVLFHILAGVPPFSGRAEDRGLQMLRTIMTSDADFDALRTAGVSEAGIDFVAQLLNRDPFSRPTEKKCFQHPWISEVPDVDEYEDDDDLLYDYQDRLSIIGEDPEDELDASQLSIADGPGYVHEADGEESSGSEAISKRPRTQYIPTDVHYPSLPNIESFQDGQAVVDNSAKRLFGEITPSALRSSHALGNIQAFNANNFHVDFLSSGESMMSDDPNESIISLPAVPFGGTAPSLMGAEKLVGQLNMNSLNPTPQLKGGPVNRSSLRQTPPGHTKGETLSSSPKKDSLPPTSSPKAESVSSPQEATPKAKFTRRIDLTLAIPDTASEASSDNSDHNSHRDTTPNYPSRPSKSEYDVEFATTLDAQTGQAILDRVCVEEADSSEPIVHRPNSPPIPSTLYDPEFAKPPKRYGKLKSLPGSIFDLTIYLEDRLTSWGRGPSATVKHADSMDTRIPAYALEVTFWTPGIEARIATGESWLDIPGVMAILSTKARLGIWVNDTLLRRGSMTEDGPEALQFGKLYTGDIITVYQNKDRTKFLKLQCEFTHGESAQPRPGPEAGFMVRQALMSKADRTTNRMPIQSQCKDRNTQLFGADHCDDLIAVALSPRGRGWSSPGLVPGSGSTSPNKPSSGSLLPGTPGSVSWAEAKAKSEEVYRYPSFSTRNSGFFSRQRHKIFARFPSLRRLSSQGYVDKDDYGREWNRPGSGRGLLGALRIPVRRGRFRLLLALFLVWIGYMFCWATIVQTYRRSPIGGGSKFVIILGSNVEGGVMEWKGAREWAIERNSIWNKKRYAKKWGYELELANLLAKKRYSHEWRESWEKGDVIRKAMRKYPDAEWFWWLDLNTWVMEYDTSLQHHIFNDLKSHVYRDINAYNPINITHPLPEFWLDELGRSREGDGQADSLNMLLTQDCSGFNLGSFFLRRSLWTERLLDVWWDPVMYEQMHMEWEHKEQDALEYIYQSQPWVRSGVGFLPQRSINSFPPGACGDGENPVVHYQQAAHDLVVNMAGCMFGRDCWSEIYYYRELSNWLGRSGWERLRDSVVDLYDQMTGKVVDGDE